MKTEAEILEEQKQRLERYAKLSVEQQRDESETLLMEYALAFIRVCETIKLQHQLIMQQDERAGEMGRRIETLNTALSDALEGMEDMYSYVDPYFRQKWDHMGTINRTRKILGMEERIE